MQHKLLHEASGQRTFVVVLETGEEVVASLQKFATRESVDAASFTAIGALSDAVLLYFDWQKKVCLKIPVREQVEVASLIGDIADDPEGKPALHISYRRRHPRRQRQSRASWRRARPAHPGSRRDRKPGAPTQGEGYRNGPRSYPPGRVADRSLNFEGHGGYSAQVNLWKRQTVVLPKGAPSIGFNIRLRRPTRL
jgi:Plants and Prokaryotes Conserved (PCC) domain